MKDQTEGEAVVTLANETHLEHVARMAGEGSMAARTLSDVRRRRAAGEDVGVMIFTRNGRQAHIIGPIPADRTFPFVHRRRR